MPDRRAQIIALPTTQIGDALTHREEILWRIAELYPALVDPLNSGSGIPGTGDRLPMLDPKLYTATVREFERLLTLMKTDRSESLVTLSSGAKHSVRSLLWHLGEWHLRCETVVRHEPVKARGKHGKVSTLVDTSGRPVTAPKLAKRRHPAAREKLAEQAIVWMAARWSLPVEPMLPAAVVEPIRTAA